MTDDPDRPDRPGPGDLQAPFLFVPHGAPEPTEWMRKHPGWVKFPATFVPRAPTAVVRTIPGTNRPWPLDKRGQPWPCSRFGQPLRPLDEYPPGVRAPGEAYTGPIADPDKAVRSYLEFMGVLGDPGGSASGDDALMEAYRAGKAVADDPGKYAGYPRPEATPAQFVPVVPVPPPPAPGVAPSLGLPPPPSWTKPAGPRGAPRSAPPAPARAPGIGGPADVLPGLAPRGAVETLIPPPPVPPVHDAPMRLPNEPEMFPSDEGVQRQPPPVTPPAPQLPAVEELVPPEVDPGTVFERSALRENMKKPERSRPARTPTTSCRVADRWMRGGMRPQHSSS